MLEKMIIPLVVGKVNATILLLLLLQLFLNVFLREEPQNNRLCTIKPCGGFRSF